ncbi:hypothetical protein [Azospirillum doebereinerae]
MAHNRASAVFSVKPFHRRANAQPSCVDGPEPARLLQRGERSEQDCERSAMVAPTPAFPRWAGEGDSSFADIQHPSPPLPSGGRLGWGNRERTCADWLAGHGKATARRRQRAGIGKAFRQKETPAQGAGVSVAGIDSPHIGRRLGE